MANGIDPKKQGPGSKHKRVKSDYLKGSRRTDVKQQSFNHPRDKKEYKREQKLKSKLANLNKKKDSRVLEGKGTKNIDRRIKRKKKQISKDTFWQKLKRWDGSWN